MVNETINESIISVNINEDVLIGRILSFIQEKISNLSGQAIQKLSELGAQPNPFVISLFSLFVGGLLVYFGLKIGQKVLKVLLVLLGIIILISTGYTLVA